jgi:hypothetical protein
MAAAAEAGGAALNSVVLNAGAVADRVAIAGVAAGGDGCGFGRLSDTIEGRPVVSWLRSSIDRLPVSQPCVLVLGPTAEVGTNGIDAERACSGKIPALVCGVGGSGRARMPWSVVYCVDQGGGVTEDAGRWWGGAKTRGTGSGRRALERERACVSDEAGVVVAVVAMAR